jgi:hypothetical protein
MQRKTLLFGVVLAASSIMVGCSDSDESTSKARVRVMHASYDAPAVNVNIDGATAINSLAYGAASAYAEIEAGTRAIDVLPAAGGNAVISAELPFAANTDSTVYAVNMLGSIEAIVSTDERTASAGKAKVRFIHASPDAPAVDIKLDTGDGTAVFSNIAFKGISPYAEVDPGTYNFVVTGAGDTRPPSCLSKAKRSQPTPSTRSSRSEHSMPPTRSPSWRACSSIAPMAMHRWT